MTKRRSLLFWLVVLLQIGILVWVALTNQRILMTGEPMLLKTVPVDPQDPLRGEYARLNYAMNRIDLHGAQVDPALQTIEQGATIYVDLKEEGGYMVPNAYMTEIPWMWPNTLMKGKVRWRDGNNLYVEYGIEQYFTPQGRAIEIERANTGSVDVQVRLSGSGVARIEKVIVDGKEIQYESGNEKNSSP